MWRVRMPGDLGVVEFLVVCEIVERFGLEHRVDGGDRAGTILRGDRVELGGELRLELLAHLAPHVFVRLVDGGLVRTQTDGDPGERREPAVGGQANLDEAGDPGVERPVTQIRDVEDREIVAHQPTQRRQHELGAILEVPVHGSIRHRGAFGDGLDGRFTQPVALACELDERIEHGVLVAVATSGSTVDHEVAPARRVVGELVVHGVLRGVVVGHGVPPQGLEP